jgi:hypothetical protein
MFLSAHELQLYCLFEELGIVLGSSEDGSEDSSIFQLEEDT